MLRPPAPQPIVVVDHDPAWAEVTARLIGEIRAACGRHIVSIEHIGSTSVPGLAAKPIIDLMPALPAFEDGFGCVDAMTALGYEARGEFGIAGRHYFPRPAGPRRLAVHVHMFAADHPEYRRHVLFRDYLRAHPARADAYGALKRELAVRFGADREGYTDAKSAFIRETDALAAAWDAAGHPPDLSCHRHLRPEGESRRRPRDAEDGPFDGPRRGPLGRLPTHPPLSPVGAPSPRPAGQGRARHPRPPRTAGRCRVDWR